MKQLTLIAADEVHTIWGWTFRKQFKQIGQVRIALSNIPFAAFSATFPPHVVGYVQKACKMNRPLDVITINGRRCNINILIAIQSNWRIYQPILNLILTNDEELIRFPKTLIFVDSILNARCMAIALRDKLKMHFPEANSSTTIRTYYSSIDDEKKEATINLFRNGQALLTIATDAMSLGVDISDIERVIQWGITERLTLDTLVQRIGRAARESSLLGLAIIYTPRDLLDPVTAECIKTMNPPQTTSQIPLNLAPDEEWEDIVDAVPRYADRDLRAFALPVEPETITEVQQLRMKMYRHINSIKDTAREAESERKAAKRDDDGNTVKKQPIDKIEPGIIWFLNTTGCRHRCILEYMRFPDVFEDDKQESWCCDNCAIRNGITISMPREYDVPEPASLRQAAKRNVGSRMDWIAINQGVQSRPNYTKDTEIFLLAVLRKWRKHIFMKLVERGVIFKFLPEQVVLSDRIIKEIISKHHLRHAVTLDGLRMILMRGKVNVDSTLLREKDIVEMFNMIDSTFEKLKHGNIHTRILV
jgi:Helicase conserved C-terminal domain